MSQSETAFLFQRAGVLLSAIRRVAHFLTLQRYYISIAVYEYNGMFFSRLCVSLALLSLLQRYSVTVLQSIYFSPKILLYYI